MNIQTENETEEKKLNKRTTTETQQLINNKLIETSH